MCQSGFPKHSTPCMYIDTLIHFLFEVRTTIVKLKKLCATVQNLYFRLIWQPEFVYFWIIGLSWIRNFAVWCHCILYCPGIVICFTLWRASQRETNLHNSSVSSNCWQVFFCYFIFSLHKECAVYTYIRLSHQQQFGRIHISVFSTFHYLFLSFLTFHIQFDTEIRYAKFFQKSDSPPKFLGTWKVTWNKFCNEYPPVLGVSVYNLVAMAIRRPEIFTPSFRS